GSPLTLQAGFFCLLMAPEAYAPLRQFAAHYHDRAAARAAVSQVAAAFDGLPDLDAQAGDGNVAPLKGCQTPDEDGASAGRVAPPASLVAHGLTVRAAGRPDPVLDDARLALQPGMHAALMGPSGSGKTTLL